MSALEKKYFRKVNAISFEFTGIFWYFGLLEGPFYGKLFVKDKHQFGLWQTVMLGRNYYWWDKDIPYFRMLLIDNFVCSKEYFCEESAE